MWDFLESIRKDFGLEKFKIILQATDLPALTRSDPVSLRGHSYGNLTRRPKFTWQLLISFLSVYVEYVVQKSLNKVQPLPPMLCFFSVVRNENYLVIARFLACKGKLP